MAKVESVLLYEIIKDMEEFEDEILEDNLCFKGVLNRIVCKLASQDILKDKTLIKRFQLVTLELWEELVDDTKLRDLNMLWLRCHERLCYHEYKENYTESKYIELLTKLVVCSHLLETKRQYIDTVNLSRKLIDEDYNLNEIDEAKINKLYKEITKFPSSIKVKTFQPYLSYMYKDNSRHLDLEGKFLNHLDILNSTDSCQAIIDLIVKQEEIIESTKDLILKELNIRIYYYYNAMLAYAQGQLVQKL